MNVLAYIAALAAADRKVIVLPEGDDGRVLVAAGRVAERGLAEVILIGNARAVADKAKAAGVDLTGVRVVDTNANADKNAWTDKYADVLMDARAQKGMGKDTDMDEGEGEDEGADGDNNPPPDKGGKGGFSGKSKDKNNPKNINKGMNKGNHKDMYMTHAQALEEIRNPLTLAACMVACGDADGCVAGAANVTANVVRAALQIVGVKSRLESNATSGLKNGLVSSFFIMQHDQPHQALRGAAIFADCALVIEPDAAQLARIAIDSTDSAVALLGIKPRVALLSFSTAGSARHPHVTKVREAGEIIAQQRPDIALLPEVQFDAAVIPEILRRKAPDINIEAPANIFIFPDLQSANIGYKIAERIGAATAIGPIFQGLKRPVNDLSRGCSVEDIVSLVAVTALQAQKF